MPSPSDWKVPSAVEPKPEDYGYDLDRELKYIRDRFVREYGSGPAH